jgi:ankyrin repeat protein
MQQQKLHWTSHTAELGHVKVVQVLLEGSAKVDSNGNYGWTALPCM